MCYCLENLHVEGPNCPLQTVIKIYPKWRINMMTSEFFKKLENDDVIKKFRHYGKNKKWNLKNFISTTSLQSFIAIPFICEEQWIKQFFGIGGCQNDDVTGGQVDRLTKKKILQNVPN